MLLHRRLISESIILCSYVLPDFDCLPKHIYMKPILKS